MIETCLFLTLKEVLYIIVTVQEKKKQQLDKIPRIVMNYLVMYLFILHLKCF